MMAFLLRLFWVVPLFIVAAGCVEIRELPAPNIEPLEVPAAQGQVTAIFTDMITEIPVPYPIDFPNLGGVFVGESYRVVSDEIELQPVLHFKLEEPLAPYILRFFNETVPPFEPIGETGVMRSDNGEQFYYAYPVTVEALEGWLVIQVRAMTPGINVKQYEGWFVAMLTTAEIHRNP